MTPHAAAHRTIESIEAIPARAPAPWWCAPSGLALGFLLPVFCLVGAVVEFDLSGLTARGLRFLDTAYLLLGVGLIFAMALGGWLGRRIDTGGRFPAPEASVDRAALVIGGIALIAYAVWFRGYLADPGWLWAILTGASSPARSDELVTGVTSLANGAPVFFSLYAWRRAFRNQRGVHAPMHRGLHVLLVGLVVLTAFRVYAWSERLALIEAMVPMALVLALKAAGSRRWWLRLAAQLGPLIAVPLLMLYFGLAESVRSWTSDTYHGKIDFWDFVIGRMATYYYTALNNGAGYLATQEWPSFKFEYTLSMLHTAPLAVGKVFSALVGSQGQNFDVFLSKYADMEFNNPSGFYTVIYDMGIPLGILYFFAVGLGAGLLFRRWQAGSLTGAMLYPVFFITFLEVFRYPYLGSGRAFAWCVCALLVLAMVYPGRYRERWASWQAA